LVSQFPILDRKYRKDIRLILENYNDTLIKILNKVANDNNWQKRQEESLSTVSNIVENFNSNNEDLIMTGLSKLDLKISPTVINSLLASDEDLSARERTKMALETDDNEEQESTDNDEPIEVMTMHSSKGLSKQLVIIPAFDEKLLPGDDEGERLAERHRLVYVAVTRAKEQVLITFPNTRAKGDPLNYAAKPKISSYADILLPLSNR
jgi:superfamily I DNA/RNA helicase